MSVHFTAHTPVSCRLLGGHFREMGKTFRRYPGQTSGKPDAILVHIILVRSTFAQIQCLINVQNSVSLADKQKNNTKVFFFVLDPSV